MKPVNILLVEDDEVDVMAVRRALRDLKIANPLTRACDGVEALEILRSGKLKAPYIILLDLNMPRMGGIEFLENLRADPDLQRAVVFVMTTSAAEEDRINAYNKNVAGYVLKHDPGRTFLDAVAMLEHYWRVIEFP
jgi:CheY-like chemotaxis protein